MSTPRTTLLWRYAGCVFSEFHWQRYVKAIMYVCIFGAICLRFKQKVLNIQGRCEVCRTYTGHPSRDHISMHCLGIAHVESVFRIYNIPAPHDVLSILPLEESELGAESSASLATLAAGRATARLRGGLGCSWSGGRGEGGGSCCIASSIGKPSWADA